MQKGRKNLLPWMGQETAKGWRLHAYLGQEHAPQITDISWSPANENKNLDILSGTSMALCDLILREELPLHWTLAQVLQTPSRL
ncbi:hypothetical protein GUJ93_ZPchr0006g41510 [Zizania palustris]|uniref:Uncharacterized protein n=1 Tax=Zizania palustris TaxID=103762 RepID=A0A8J5W4A6_ZIZPA|nr:hypothetical protein GUJ93_ZPchr0006g41510 [Zizania palustris]